MNVPKLRFAGFEGNWSPVTLGELTELSDGTHFTPDYKVEGIPFWSVETITSNAPVKYISKEEHESLIKRCYPQKNDILITRISSGINSLGVPKLIDWDGEFSIYVSVGLIKANPKFDSRFMTEYLVSPNYKREFLSKSLLTAAPKKINMDSLGTTTIKLAPLEEQIKIGKYMGIINKKIQLQQEKIDLLKEQKKGFIQKIFSQELRFKGFNEDWKECKLGNLVEIVTGKLDANAMDENGKYDFYTSGIKKYKINIPAFEGPAITIAGNGATVGYMHYADGLFNAYQRTYVLSKFAVNRDFLFHYIGFKLPKKIQQEARTGNIPYIVMDMLTELRIKLPSDSEQEKIGQVFKKLDKLIKLNEEKISLLQEQKKGFMQQMFI